MRLELCLCSQIPLLEITTKVIIVISKRELLVPTNTGRLAAQALANSVILVRGDQKVPYSLREHLRPERKTLLLYPADDAAILTTALVRELGGCGVIDLVVPDGNWRQTSKMRRRDEVMAQLQTVRLPAGGASSRYQVRKETKPEGLATIEALARVLGVIEGPKVEKELDQLLQVMVSRVLASRGY
jgi:DTW domain-containing protein YfiP